MAVPGILHLLSELAPGGGGEVLDVSEAAPVAWIGVAPRSDYDATGSPTLVWPPPDGLPSSKRFDHLFRLDALHPGEQLLRVGWVYLVGELVREGVGRPCCLPLVTQPIKVRNASFGRVRLESAGPWDLLGLVDDVALAGELEGALAFSEVVAHERPFGEHWLTAVPDLRRWIHAVVDAAGLPEVQIVADDSIDSRQGAVRALVGFGIHAALDVDATDLRSSLANWAGTPGVDGTAFARLYLPPGEAGPPPSDDVWSSLPLTSAQEQAVHRARHDPVTVVSGPPGTARATLPPPSPSTP